VGRGYRSPATAATLGIVSGMILSPANEVDIFRIFNGDDGAYDPAEVAVYRDNMQSYSATEPAIDLTSTSFLMWSRRSATTQASGPTLHERSWRYRYLAWMDGDLVWCQNKPLI